MKYNYLKNTLLICVLFLVHGVSQAEPVTSMTIENVGHGGQDAYQPPSLTFNDAGPTEAGIMQLHGYSGAFSFGPILDNDAVGAASYYLAQLLGPIGAPLADRGTVFSTDVSPIDATQANPINPATNSSFSTGFNFANQPFVPNTKGPIVADISIVAGQPQLTITSLPWHGDYVSGSPTAIDFNLRPQTAAEAAAAGCFAGVHVDLTTRWINRIGTTDKYNYKIVWTHCISAAEDPSFQFVGFRASWILEGIMTAPDTTAPTVLNVNPADASTGVATNSAVSVTFSEEMDPTTITTASFTVTPNVGGATECESITTADNITFTCNPVGGLFTGSTLFDVSLSTAICDSVSDTTVCLASAFSSQFTTAAGVDSTPPTLVSTTPADLTVGVATNVAVDVVFNEAMGATTLNAITVSENGNTVSGQTTTTDNLTFTFTPDNVLLSNTQYTVDISGTAAQDAAGNALGGDVSTTFTTVLTGSLPVSPQPGDPVISVDTSTGASLVSLTVVSPAQIGFTLPDRVILDDVFVDFVINGVTGGAATVTIAFPDPITGKEIYKAINGAYTKLEEGTGQGQYQRVNDTTITMTILDNGPNDSDPTVGIIHDPIGTGLDRGAAPTPGSLGCTTVTGTSVSPLDRADMFLLMGLILWYGLARRRKQS